MLTKSRIRIERRLKLEEFLYGKYGILAVYCPEDAAQEMHHDNNAECEGVYEMPTLASELEVLIATTVWLVRNGWNIEAISVAGGHGLPPVDYQKEEIRKAFNAESVPFDKKMFKPRGPDIVARSHEGIWKIECKGLGKGKASTHRTNFDRAVASAMSYFDTPPTRLGLALANDYLWAYNFSERLPQALRKATNLWVFLLEKGTIYLYEPTEEIPFPGAA